MVILKILYCLGGGLVMAKMGRPKVGNPKTKTVAMRLTPEQYDEVNAYSRNKGQTVTKTLLQGYYLLREKDKEEKH